MRIKTFYASTMAEALESIKAELGTDALILSTKETPRRSAVGAHLASGFEVVAAIDEVLPQPADAAPVHPYAERNTSGKPEGDFTAPSWSKGSVPALSSGRTGQNRDSEAREQRGRDTGTSNFPARNVRFAGGEATILYRNLLSNGISDWLAYKLLDEAQSDLQDLQRVERNVLLRSVADVARDMLSDPPPKSQIPGKRVVAFVGPTGVGKTTSLAKLAARLTLEQGKKVLLLSLDGYRIGAAEQLRTYASLLGVPFRFVSQLSELDRVLEEHVNRDHVLIDTAGRAPRDLSSMGEVLGFLKESDEVECHLVLSATTKPGDLEDIVDHFDICDPDYLLFTKLDETSTFGPIFNEMVRTQKTLSYVADGQRVPEDFHSAMKDQIVDIVLQESRYGNIHG